MYLIKRLGFHRFEDRIIVEDGISAGILSDKKAEIVASFWGNSNLILSEDFISNASKNAENGVFKLEYADSYDTKKMKDGFIELTLSVNSFDEYSEEIEGYIIFFNQMGADVSTDGEQLFRRYYYERIVVLREGQYFKFYDNTAKVIDGELIIN